MYLKIILIFFILTFCFVFAQKDKQEELASFIQKLKNSGSEVPWDDLEHLSDFISSNPNLDYSSKELIPLLIKYLVTPEPEKKINIDAKRALVSLSKRGISVSSYLNENLDSDNEALCIASLYVLTCVEKENRENSIPKIFKLCRHKNGNLREYATLALFQIGGGTPEIIIELIFQLGDFAYNRNQARSFLVEIGSPAVPYLIQALENKNGQIRRFTAITLGDMGFHAKEAIQDLLRALKEEDEMAQYAIEQAILSIATDKTELTLNLVKLLKNENFYTRRGTLEVLHKILYEMKKDALLQEVTSLVIQALKDDHWEVRSSAASALGAINSERDKIVPILIETLQDKDWQVRKSVILAFKDLSPPHSIILPSLLRGLEDERWEVREVSAFTMNEIRVRGTEVIQSLIKALKDESGQVRRQVSYTLGNMKSEAKEAVPHLTLLLEDKDINVRNAAKYALEKIQDF